MQRREVVRHQRNAPERASVRRLRPRRRPLCEAPGLRGQARLSRPECPMGGELPADAAVPEPGASAEKPRSRRPGADGPGGVHGAPGTPLATDPDREGLARRERRRPGSRCFDVAGDPQNEARTWTSATCDAGRRPGFELPVQRVGPTPSFVPDPACLLLRARAGEPDLPLEPRACATSSSVDCSDPASVPYPSTSTCC